MNKPYLRRNINIYDDLQSTSKSFNRREVVKVLSSRVKRLSNMENTLDQNIEKIEMKYDDGEEMSTGDVMKYNQKVKQHRMVAEAKERLETTNEKLISQTRKERVIKMKPKDKGNKNKQGMAIRKFMKEF